MKARALLLSGAALLLLLSACGGDDSDSSANTTSAPAASDGGEAAEGAKVVAKSIAYNPTELTVKVGDTVIFSNQDSFAHTFTADDGAFDSGNVDQGGTFTFAPDAAGTIEFHCKIHSNMQGTLTVEA